MDGDLPPPPLRAASAATHEEARVEMGHDLVKFADARVAAMAKLANLRASVTARREQMMDLAQKHEEHVASVHVAARECHQDNIVRWIAAKQSHSCMRRGLDAWSQYHGRRFRHKTRRREVNLRLSRERTALQMRVLHHWHEDSHMQRRRRDALKRCAHMEWRRRAAQSLSTLRVAVEKHDGNVLRRRVKRLEGAFEAEIAWRLAQRKVCEWGWFAWVRVVAKKRALGRVQACAEAMRKRVILTPVFWQWHRAGHYRHAANHALWRIEHIQVHALLRSVLDRLHENVEWAKVATRTTAIGRRAAQRNSGVAARRGWEAWVDAVQRRQRSRARVATATVRRQQRVAMRVVRAWCTLVDERRSCVRIARLVHVAMHRRYDRRWQALSRLRAAVLASASAVLAAEHAELTLARARQRTKAVQRNVARRLLLGGWNRWADHVERRRVRRRNAERIQTRKRRGLQATSFAAWKKARSSGVAQRYALRRAVLLHDAALRRIAWPRWRKAQHARCRADRTSTLDAAIVSKTHHLGLVRGWTSWVRRVDGQVNLNAAFDRIVARCRSGCVRERLVDWRNIVVCRVRARAAVLRAMGKGLRDMRLGFDRLRAHYMECGQRGAVLLQERLHRTLISFRRGIVARGFTRWGRVVSSKRRRRAARGEALSLCRRKQLNSFFLAWKMKTDRRRYSQNKLEKLLLRNAQAQLQDQIRVRLGFDALRHWHHYMSHGSRVRKDLLNQIAQRSNMRVLYLLGWRALHFEAMRARRLRLLTVRAKAVAKTSRLTAAFIGWIRVYDAKVALRSSAEKANAQQRSAASRAADRCMRLIMRYQWNRLKNQSNAVRNAIRIKTIGMNFFRRLRDGELRKCWKAWDAHVAYRFRAKAIVRRTKDRKVTARLKLSWNQWYRHIAARVSARCIMERIAKKRIQTRIRRGFAMLRANLHIALAKLEAHNDKVKDHAIRMMKSRTMYLGWNAWVRCAAARRRKVSLREVSAVFQRRNRLAQHFLCWSAIAHDSKSSARAMVTALLTFKLAQSTFQNRIYSAFVTLRLHARVSALDEKRALLQSVALRNRDKVVGLKTLHHWMQYVAIIFDLRHMRERVARKGRHAKQRRCFRKWQYRMDLSDTLRSAAQRLVRCVCRGLVRRAWSSFLINLHGANKRHHSRVIGGTIVRRQKHMLVQYGWTAWVTEANARKRMRIVGNNIMRRWRAVKVHSLWSSWLEFVDKRTLARGVMNRMVARAKSQGIGRAMSIWRQCSRDATSQERGGHRERIAQTLHKMLNGVIAGGFRGWVDAVERKRRRYHLNEQVKIRSRGKKLRSTWRRWLKGLHRASYARCAMRAAYFRVTAKQTATESALQHALMRLHLNAQLCVIQETRSRLQSAAVRVVRKELLFSKLQKWSDIVEKRVRFRTRGARMLKRQREKTRLAFFDAWYTAYARAKGKKRQLRRIVGRSARTRVRFALNTLRKHVRAVHTHNRTKTITANTLRHITHATVAKGWVSWVERVESKVRTRAVLKRVAHRWKYAQARHIFGSWHDVVEHRVRARCVLLRVFGRIKILRVVRSFDVLKTLWSAHKTRSRAIKMERARAALLSWRALSVTHCFQGWAHHVERRFRQRELRVLADKMWRKRCFSGVFRAWGAAIRYNDYSTCALRAAFFRVSASYSSAIVGLRSGFDTLRMNARTSVIEESRDRLQKLSLGKSSYLDKMRGWQRWIETADALIRKRSIKSRSVAMARQNVQKRAWVAWCDSYASLGAQRTALQRICRWWESHTVRRGWRRFIAGCDATKQIRHSELLLSAVVRRRQQQTKRQGWRWWVEIVATRVHHRAVVARTHARMREAQISRCWDNWLEFVRCRASARSVVSRMENKTVRNRLQRGWNAMHVRVREFASHERAIAVARGEHILRSLQNITLSRGWNGWTEKLVAAKRHRAVFRKASELNARMTARSCISRWVEECRNRKEGIRVLSLLDSRLVKRKVQRCWCALQAHSLRVRDAGRLKKVEARVLLWLQGRTQSVGWNAWVTYVARATDDRAQMVKAVSWVAESRMLKCFTAWQAHSALHYAQLRVVRKLVTQRVAFGLSYGMEQLRANVQRATAAILAKSAKEESLALARSVRAEVWSTAHTRGVRHFFAAWALAFKLTKRRRRVRRRAFVRIHIRHLRGYLHGWHVVTLECAIARRAIQRCEAARHRSHLVVALQRWRTASQWRSRASSAVQMLQHLRTRHAAGPLFRLWSEQAALYQQVIVRPEGKRAVLRRAGACTLAVVERTMRANSRRDRAVRTLRAWVRHASSLKRAREQRVVHSLVSRARTYGGRLLRRAFSRMRSAPPRVDQTLLLRKQPAPSVRCVEIVRVAFEPSSSVQRQALGLIMLSKLAGSYERRVTLRRFARWRIRSTLLAESMRHASEDPMVPAASGEARKPAVTQLHINALQRLKQKMMAHAHESDAESETSGDEN